jgi:hypothetical protein
MLPHAAEEPRRFVSRSCSGRTTSLIEHLALNDGVQSARLRCAGGETVSFRPAESLPIRHDLPAGSGNLAIIKINRPTRGAMSGQSHWFPAPANPAG